MRLGILCGVLLQLLLCACKPNGTLPVSKRFGRKSSNPVAVFNASSETEVRQKNNFYQAIFNKDYEKRFDTLAARGEVAPERVPYAGSWYPQKNGGTNVRIRGASPLEKYDSVFNTGSSSKAADWELKNHMVTSGDASAGWAGHCNGFSASSTRHLEPKNQVKRGDMIFYPEDIKALLAEVYMGAKFYFLGGNRCGLRESGVLASPGSRVDRTTLDECDDVNPGSFHLALTNWIGIQRYPLVVDTYGKEQVWNYPHWKYEYSNVRINSKSEAMGLIVGQGSSTYDFNPAATSFQRVTMTVTYAAAYEAEVLTAQLSAAQRNKSKTYSYLLELNDSGEIIGGEWLGDSQRDHPDFIWVALEPMPGDGSNNSSNPYVDSKEVLKLWAESIGADPNNPPKDLTEPELIKSWGQYTKFDILMNGAKSGVAFAIDDKLEVSFKVKTGLNGANLDFKFDGITTVVDPGKLAVTIPKPAAGIHVLEMKWIAAGKIVEDQRARIHVIR